MKEDSIPEEPGIYLLCLRVRENCCLKIGKAGERFFPRGNYVYVGSAQGVGYHAI